MREQLRKQLARVRELRVRKIEEPGELSKQHMHTDAYN